MKKSEAETIIRAVTNAITSLVDNSARPSAASDPPAVIKPAGKALTLERPVLEGTDNTGGVSQPFADPEVEKMFQAFKARWIEEAAVDPVLLHLATTRPEMIVDVERRVVELNGGTDLKGRIARLLAQGFFKEPRRGAEINRELARTGTEAAGNRLSEALFWLVQAGFLVRDGLTYQAAAGVKVTERTIESRG